MWKKQTVEKIDIEVLIGYNKLRRVNLLKILYLYIDNELNWDKNYNNVCKKAYVQLSKINYVKFVNKTQRLTLGSATVIPSFNYAASVWFIGKLVTWKVLIQCIDVLLDLYWIKENMIK